MKTFKEFISESVEHLAADFSKHYSHDPGGVYNSVKNSHLDHITRLKSTNLKASNLNQQFKTMSKGDFERHVIGTVVPHLKKAGWPKHDSKEFHDAIYHGSKSVTD